MSSKIILVVHNVRSAHNVGSLLRTADGLGVLKVYLSGYTPYPDGSNDGRLPHLAKKQSARINKTALGAEKMIDWAREEGISKIIKDLKADGYEIIALEQTKSSRPLGSYKVASKAALLVGSEIGGLDEETLRLADVQLHIPMEGQKESFNVSIAAAIALYHLKLKGDRQID